MSRPLSRRRRRVALTCGLFALFAAGAIFLARALTSDSETYTPGEEIEGLTAELARDLPADYPRVTFTDVTEAAGIDFRHFPARRTRQLPEDMGSGAAWGDYDNDGWPDLVLVDVAAALPGSDPEGGLAGDAGEAASSGRTPGRSRLYRNQRDGTFRDVTEEAGIDHRTVGMAASWADYDADGWLDLFLTAYGENTLYRNRGDGTFEDATRAAGMAGRRGFWTAAAWGDYDGDGDLDLYVTGYVQYTIGAGRGVSGRQYDVEVPASLNPSAFRPHPNLLWRNRGDGTFAEASSAAGVADAQGRGLGAAWADFDEDGRLDLYVANDVSDNALFHNRGDGTFENVSHGALVADYRGAMGLAIADWDGDEDLDLFITHWIAQENALFSNRLADFGADDGDPRPLQFIDEADRFGLGQIALDFIGWGTSFFDYDNDGLLDLFVSNGSTFQRSDDPDLLTPMRDQLFWNRGAGEGFYDVSPVAGDHFRTEKVGRGAAFADYDRDGDVDLIVLNHGDRPTLLRNEAGGRALGVLAERRGAGRSAFGARIRVVAGAATQVRSVGSQTSYLSQNSLVEHFGLGEAERADTLEVVWPGGGRDVWTGIPAGRTVRVVEGASAPVELGGGAAGAAASAREATLRFWESFREATRLRHAGRTAEAAAGYEAALAFDPDHADALYYLGSLRLELGAREAAEAALTRLLEIDPRSGRAHSQMGVLYACPGEGVALDLERAAASFEGAWAINREQTGPPLWLGVTALLAGDHRAAADRFAEVLGSNPGSIAANAFTGYVAYLDGREDAARASLERARELAGSQSSGGEEIGLGEGDTRDGRPLFAAASSCRWLEDRLVALTSPEPATGGDDPLGRYRALSAEIRTAGSGRP